MARICRVTVTEVKPSATDYDVVTVTEGLPYGQTTLNVLQGTVQVGDALEIRLVRGMVTGRGKDRSFVYGMDYVKRPDGKDVMKRNV